MGGAVATLSEWPELSSFVDTCMAEAPVLSEFGAMEPSITLAANLAKRHYAEVRTFTDLKLPCRMRICPHDAHLAKKFFWEIYQEEQGGFEPGKNHAEVFRAFCLDVGLTEEILEDEYQGYWPNYAYLLTEPPSMTALVRELAVSYAWESAIARVAPQLQKLLDSVLQELGREDVDVRYFDEHVVLDVHHAEMAADVLVAYAVTEDLRDVAKASIRDTLVTQNPWMLPLHT